MLSRIEESRESLDPNTSSCSYDLETVFYPEIFAFIYNFTANLFPPRKEI